VRPKAAVDSPERPGERDSAVHRRLQRLGVVLISGSGTTATANPAAGAASWAAATGSCVLSTDHHEPRA
jgi:hypothetical protein